MKNIVDTIFFTLRALCRGTAQSSADRIGETRFGLSPRAAALASGMVGTSENTSYPEAGAGAACNPQSAEEHGDQKVQDGLMDQIDRQ